MKSVAIFFDTEFTSFETPELISLGAVTLDGKHEFYAEVSPLPDGRSGFVDEIVVPQLSGPAYPKEEVARRFIEWLCSMQTHVKLSADSPYDQKMVEALCGKFPLRLLKGARCFWSRLPGATGNYPHHSLEDAKLLRQMFSAYV